MQVQRGGGGGGEKLLQAGNVVRRESPWNSSVMNCQVLAYAVEDEMKETKLGGGTKIDPHLTDLGLLAKFFDSDFVPVFYLLRRCGARSRQNMIDVF